eukprot:TRINITY_DN58379_c0_g1_i1.p1 TRINITY_DN58379_c0_g1~~TRINITY_DN58379_c0_g1_i1.p1  ORF type:complete len:415 (+),score=54.71 TRINITY_DN58379_c0_g1_i1:88-1332(+)
MCHIVFSLLVTILVCSAARIGVDSPSPLPHPHHNASNRPPFTRRVFVTTSGISAGAFMAVQHGVSYSSSVFGMGVVAGGPFWCASDSLTVAVSACMVAPELIVLDDLYAATEFAYHTDTADAPSNLLQSSALLFTGTKDDVVYSGVVEHAASYLRHYIDAGANASKTANAASSRVRLVNNIPAAHGFPTLSAGNPCGTFGSPYIQACGFDGAGVILKHVYTQAGLNLTEPPPPAPAPPSSDAPSSTSAGSEKHAGQLVRLSTSAFLPPLVESPSIISLHEATYVYVPPQCDLHTNRSGAARTRAAHESGDTRFGTGVLCSVHIAYHGCEQTVGQIGLEFILQAGYLRWADANGIIVIFPQAVISNDFPYNPKGCFDWWGYTGSQYASQDGLQLWTVDNVLRHVVDTWGPKKDRR